MIETEEQKEELMQPRQLTLRERLGMRDAGQTNQRPTYEGLSVGPSIGMVEAIKSGSLKKRSIEETSFYDEVLLSKQHELESKHKEKRKRVRVVVSSSEGESSSVHFSGDSDY